MNRPLSSLIAGMAFLMLIIFIISSFNTRHYYINNTDGAIEIWQGKFAPLGKELLITLPGGFPPESMKAKYTKGEVYPLICNYYLEKSLALLDQAGLPDFEIIKSDLNKAFLYASTKELEDSVTARLDSINLMTLLYKADVAASAGGIPNLKEAKNYLEKARSLDRNKEKNELIEEKMTEVRRKIEEMMHPRVEASEPAEKEKSSLDTPDMKTEASQPSTHE